MNDTEFTYDWYGSLLDCLVNSNRSFRSFGESVTDGTVLLRHDVDFSPRKAVKMAEMEASRDVRATYFFLLSSPAYNPHVSRVRRILRRIESLGHDVGLHFDASNYWDVEPDATSLRRRIREERSALATVVEDVVDTIAFHNPPEWVLNYRFEGISHTYEPQYFADIEYLADSNQRWRIQQPFQNSLPDTMQLLVHPILWGAEDHTKNDHLRTERERVFERIDSHFDRAMLVEEN